MFLTSTKLPTSAPSSSTVPSRRCAEGPDLAAGADAPRPSGSRCRAGCACPGRSRRRGRCRSWPGPRCARRRPGARPRMRVCSAARASARCASVLTPIASRWSSSTQRRHRPPRRDQHPDHVGQVVLALGVAVARAAAGAARSVAPVEGVDAEVDLADRALGLGSRPAPRRSRSREPSVARAGCARSRAGRSGSAVSIASAAAPRPGAAHRRRRLSGVEQRHVAVEHDDGPRIRAELRAGTPAARGRCRAAGSCTHAGDARVDARDLARAPPRRRARSTTSTRSRIERQRLVEHPGDHRPPAERRAAPWGARASCACPGPRPG